MKSGVIKPMQKKRVQQVDEIRKVPVKPQRKLTVYSFVSTDLTFSYLQFKKIQNYLHGWIRH